MRTVYWALNTCAPLTALRHCKKCNALAEYAPSGLFRVNAQQKSLDIWLLYRCTRCAGTWKSTILTHVSPGALPPEMLERFMNNDAALAMACAMDADRLKRNGAQPGAAQYDVVGEPIDLSEPCKLVIESDYRHALSVAKLLREQLALSKKAFDALADAGTISMESGADVRKCKLGSRAVVVIAP